MNSFYPDMEKKGNIEVKASSANSLEEESIGTIEDVKIYTIQRKLQPRSLQMVAIGGSIGTVIFLTISSGLLNAGPANLLIAFALWTAIVYFVIVCMGELACYIPIEAPFIQMAGRCVDRSFEFAVGFNYFFMTAIIIPFEITAVNSMIHYWRDDYSPAITFCVEIVIYVLLNIVAVKWYGQSEFYLSLGKFLLAIGLIFFTFITMVGGNPKHDVYGFRNWKIDPFKEYLTTGNIGKFHGFLAALNKAALTIVGPEYLCMMAGEAGGETRRVMSRTFKTTVVRLVIFYITGALCVGTVVASNDPTLVYLASNGSTSNGNYSPYVIAMNNLKIKILPNIVNALCITSSFSAGNSCVFCSTRALYGMAERGLAPKIFKKCTKNGVPIYCIAVAFCFACLALLQLGESSGNVLTWLVNLTTAGQLLNYFTMCITYLCFRKAYLAQGVDTSTFRYKAWYQPYLTYVAMFFLICLIGILGYTTFLPGNWSVENFLTYYLMDFIFIGLYIGHKLIYKTKIVKPEEADLISGLEEVELHEMKFLEELEKTGNQDKWYHKIYDFIF